MRSTPAGTTLLRAGAAARFLLLAAGLLVLAACTRAGAQPAANQSQSQQQLLARADEYARCMRSHGVPNYPDPTITSTGGVSINLSGSGINPSTIKSPQFQSAEQACESLQPGAGKRNNPAMQAEARENGLRTARCMHSHGYPNFPEPNGQGLIQITSGDGIDTNSSQYENTLTACSRGGPVMIQQEGPAGSGGATK
jgi:hypothetical protein